MSNFTSLSDENLIQLFQQLDTEMKQRSKSYEIFHVYMNSRRRAQNSYIENHFYHQLLTLYENDTELNLRFDPILLRLVKLFISNSFYVKTFDIPLNKYPKMSYKDDGEHVQEKLVLIDTPDIFVPKNLCTDIVKAKDFVDKIQMITWEGITITHEKWNDEWNDFIRGKGYWLKNEQLHTNKNNIDVKRKMLSHGILELDKKIIDELVKLHGDDKQTLCQAIIDIYELMQEKLL